MPLICWAHKGRFRNKYLSLMGLDASRVLLSMIFVLQACTVFGSFRISDIVSPFVYRPWAKFRCSDIHPFRRPILSS
eukprot:jgi/Botrbrau1/9990/Bobra.0012s0079.1